MTPRHSAFRQLGGSWAPYEGAAHGLPSGTNKKRSMLMSVGTILLIVLILLLIGALPAWPHSRSWGYGPTGGLGLIVVILLVLLVMGKI